MDIETMPHAMYLTGDLDTITKINHVPYQTIECNDNGMFKAKLMNDTPIEIFIDNGATPSILPLCTYKNFPILHTYPKTESNTPIHTGGGLITSHFWLEIPLKLQHQTIHITCSKSLFGSIRLQGCLSIDVEVRECLHIGNFHLQSLEILQMDFPWLVISHLVCECTEWCCNVCTDCRVSI